MKEKGNLNFHGTFGPDFEYIAKILEIADNCEGLTKEEISDMTGIPTGVSTGKVEPHIYYANYMNVIDFNKQGLKYHIYTTELGKVILNEDPYFLEYISKLICNYFLTSRIYGAKMWYKIFRVMSDKYGMEVKESVAQKDLEEDYRIKINLTPFRSCYNNEKGLASLDLINIKNIVDQNILIFNKNKYQDESMYVYAYALMKDLEKVDSNRKEFSIDEILNNIMWNRGFVWDEEVALFILEKLNDLNIISLNRQLNPITVILNCDSKDIVNKVYSLLF